MQQTKLLIILFINILFFGLLSLSTAQVIEGNVTLTTQEEVNSFSGTSITGYLRISGDNIIDLAPLSTLITVGGNLEIEFCDSLTNLDGLSNLTSVGGITLGSNSALTNVDGLSNLNSVGGNLEIEYNDVLTNIDGLSNLTSVGYDLIIYYNNSLTNLDGLNNLTSIGGSLVLNNNYAITNLDGFNNLTSIGGNLGIYENYALTNLHGLSNLTSVGSYLFIWDNTSLNSFCGIFTLLNSNGLGGDYNVHSNLVNPTQQQIIDDGACITSLDVENDLNKVMSYKLLQNYPNPFNPQTTIAFNVKEFTAVSLKLYNIQGQLVSILVDKSMQSGQYEIQFNAGDLASGVYFYHIKMGKYQLVKKMILLQ